MGKESKRVINTKTYYTNNNKRLINTTKKIKLKGGSMTSDCGKCGTAVTGKMSSQGSGKGYWVIDNQKLRVKPTYYYYGVGCERGFYKS